MGKKKTKKTKAPRSKEINIDDLIIDPLISEVLGDMEEEAFAQLEANILSDGKVRDAITVWRGRLIVVDGVHRLKVYRKHADKLTPPRIEEADFDNMEDIRSWVVEQQKGRHNLTEEKKNYIDGKWLIKKRVARPLSRYALRAHKLPAVKRKKSENRTEQRRMELAEYCDSIPGAMAAEYMAGNLKITAPQMKTFAALAPEVQGQLFARIQAEEFNVKGALASHKQESQPEPTSEELMAAHNLEIEQYARSITNAAKKHPASPWFGTQFQVVEQKAKTAAHMARKAKCEKLCPKCDAKGCETCRETGFLPKQVFDMLRL